MDARPRRVRNGELPLAARVVALARGGADDRLGAARLRIPVALGAAGAVRAPRRLRGEGSAPRAATGDPMDAVEVPLSLVRARLPRARAGDGRADGAPLRLSALGRAARASARGDARRRGRAGDRRDRRHAEQGVRPGHAAGVRRGAARTAGPQHHRGQRDCRRGAPRGGSADRPQVRAGSSARTHASSWWDSSSAPSPVHWRSSRPSTSWSRSADVLGSEHFPAPGVQVWASVSRLLSQGASQLASGRTAGHRGGPRGRCGAHAPRAVRARGGCGRSSRRPRRSASRS